MGSQPSKVDIDQAILELKIVRDKLKKHQRAHENCQAIEYEKAKDLARKGQKEQAKIILRQKKIREYYIINAEKMIQAIDNQINNIQLSQIEVNMMNNLKEGNEILKYLNELMPIEKVEKIIDENQEYQKRLDDINEILCKNTNAVFENFSDDEFNELYSQLDIEKTEQKSIETNAYSKSNPQKFAMIA